MFRNFDWKYIFIALLLLAGYVYSVIYHKEILIGIKYFFNLPFLNLSAGAVAAIFTMLHKIKTRKITLNYKMSFNEFRGTTADIISFIESPITIVCSLALAKGLFLQYTEGILFFPKFNQVEFYFIGLVTFYLSLTSIMELLNNIKETCFSKQVSPISLIAVAEKDVKEKQIPPPQQ
ncbi:MAG TPA: hypothetical protein VI757_07780 [Bacteroidia bacterium]|nr:hypothetical protein [Bacteroidia bacterium]